MIDRLFLTRARVRHLRNVAWLCAAVTLGAVSYAAGQGSQSKSEQPAQRPIQPETAAKWARLWPRLFDEPFSDGAVCSSPPLKDSYCRMRRELYPETVAFWTTPPGADPMLQYFDIRITPTRWIIAIQRDATLAETNRGVPGTLAIGKWPFAELMLTRIGFTPKVLASCGLKPRSFEVEGLIYSCQTYDRPGISKAGFSLAVESKPGADADVCTRHPLCAASASN